MKFEIFNDNFQNYKRYQIPKAQLVIADIPYNLGDNAYASNPAWYKDGDNKKGESEKAHKQFFNTDKNFNIAEFMHFCSKMLIKEPKEKGKAPAMIVFCAFQQIQMVIDYGAKYGFKSLNHPLVFIKKSSAEAMKTNMRIVGAAEYAIVLYRNKLPKFNNGRDKNGKNGQMIKNWFYWEVDESYPKTHDTQKPIPVLKRLIEIFTDKGDTVIDPCMGGGSTIRASIELNRNAYGFEIDKKYYKAAKEVMLGGYEVSLFEM